MICSKIVNTDCREAGVEFRQQFNGAIRTSLTAPYDDVQRYQKFVTN